MRNADRGTRNGGRGKQTSKVEKRSTPVPSIVKSEAHSAIRIPHFLPSWPETGEVLERLRGQVKLAVVTNCSEALTGIAVAKTRIDFTEVVTAERAGFYKPRPRAYRLALEELKENAECGSRNAEWGTRKADVESRKKKYAGSKYC